MIDDATIRNGSALRERRRVLLLCAPVTLLFTFADVLALQRFSPGVFGLRVLWSALLVGGALALGRVGPIAERRLMMLVAVASSLFFAVITWFTGGYASPLFHWILAMPLVIAVVLQDFPGATLAAAVATMFCGLAIVLGTGHGAALAIEWAVQAFGMCALAVYASVTYRRLRFREQALREAAAVAVEREKAAGEAVKSRDVFLSVAAHELRTPLTALVLNVERQLGAARAARGAEPTLESMEGIHRQVMALSRLVESLLDISRLTADRPTLDLARIDLAAAVEQVVERYRPTAQRQGCALVVHRRGSATVTVDRTRLDQVLLNLLSNAAKFGPGQPIEVTVSAERGRALVTVRDHGMGIAAADQQRIFERFDRGSASVNHAGLGLGLWISRRLIEEMNGELRVQSRPGEGAAFTFELPADASASTPAAAPTTSC